MVSHTGSPLGVTGQEPGLWTWAVAAENVFAFLLDAQLAVPAPWAGSVAWDQPPAVEWGARVP